MQSKIFQYQQVLSNIKENKVSFLKEQEEFVKSMEKRLDGRNRLWKNGHNSRRFKNRMRRVYKEIILNEIIYFIRNNIDNFENFSITEINDYPYLVSSHILKISYFFLLKVPKSKLEIVETLLSLLKKREDYSFYNEEYNKVYSNKNRYSKEDIEQTYDEYIWSRDGYLEDRSYFINWTIPTIRYVIKKDVKNLIELNKEMEIFYDY